VEKERCLNLNTLTPLNPKPLPTMVASRQRMCVCVCVGGEGVGSCRAALAAPSPPALHRVQLLHLSRNTGWEGWLCGNGGRGGGGECVNVCCVWKGGGEVAGAMDFKDYPPPPRVCVREQCVVTP
jgi:hypothetical protein